MGDEPPGLIFGGALLLRRCAFLRGILRPIHYRLGKISIVEILCHMMYVPLHEWAGGYLRRLLQVTEGVHAMAGNGGALESLGRADCVSTEGGMVGPTPC